MDFMCRHEYKSEMGIGDLTIYNTKRFNKFNRFMWRICFGIVIKDLEESEKE